MRFPNVKVVAYFGLEGSLSLGNCNLLRLKCLFGYLIEFTYRRLFRQSELAFGQTNSFLLAESVDNRNRKDSIESELTRTDVRGTGRILPVEEEADRHFARSR